MNFKNLIKIKYNTNNFEFKKELNYNQEFKNKIIFKKNNCCENCTLKLTKDYLELHFIDYDIENIDDDNLIILCKDCHRICHIQDNMDKGSLFVIPRTIDHLNQSHFIYYLRYIYVLRYKIFENDKKKNKFTTIQLIEEEILKEIYEMSYEYFEELIDEAEDLKDKDKDAKKLIDIKNYFNFINEYFINDEDKIEELEDNEEIIIIPTFEKTLDFFTIIGLYNNLRNYQINQDMINFIDKNKKIFNNSDLYLKELNSMKTNK